MSAPKSRLHMLTCDASSGTSSSPPAVPHIRADNCRPRKAPLGPSSHSRKYGLVKSKTKQQTTCRYTGGRRGNQVSEKANITHEHSYDTSTSPQRKLRPERKRCVYLSDESTSEDNDDMTSPHANLRSTHRSTICLKQDNNPRAKAANQDAPLINTEMPNNGATRSGNSRRRRTVQDVDDDFVPEHPTQVTSASRMTLRRPISAQMESTPSTSPRARSVTLDDLFCGEKDRSVAAQRRLEEEYMEELYNRYAVPEKLKGFKKAMGDEDWKLYLDWMESYIDGDIGYERLEETEKVLFQVSDTRLREQIRWSVYKMVALERMPECQLLEMGLIETCTE